MDLPGHKDHRFADKLLFGKSYPQVHRAIDLPYIFYGRTHRKFYHNYAEAFQLGYIVSREAKGALSGAFHVWLDRECSRDKDFKIWLDWAAKEDLKISKQIAKQSRRVKRDRNKKKYRV